jgi:hypothetical protein
MLKCTSDQWGIARTAYVTRGPAECPLSTRLRTSASEAPVSASGRLRTLSGGRPPASTDRHRSAATCRWSASMPSARRCSTSPLWRTWRPSCACTDGLAILPVILGSTLGTGAFTRRQGYAPGRPVRGAHTPGARRRENPRGPRRAPATTAWVGARRRTGDGTPPAGCWGLRPRR